MLYQRIRNFRPTEDREEATDQDRSVLRIAEGFMPYPQGALCSGPEWKTLWGLSDLTTDIETALSGADTDLAHFVTLAKNGHTALVCWSLDAHRALGWFWVSGGTNADLDSTGSVTISAPATAAYRDKDPSAKWYAAPAAGRILLGNGTDDNLVWEDSALAIFGPDGQPGDVNKRARERIPPCFAFRQHVNRSIFAAGNVTNPLRVWITDAPNKGEPWLNGVYSLATSFIDIHPQDGATRITGLSVFQQYVTVHTDKKPVNLYGVDNTSNGWKCEESASAANASAINPSCFGDNLEGDAAFYLGADLEVYYDQAIRSGPYEKRSARAQDIATEQGAGTWNSQALFPLQAAGHYHTIYDRDNRLFWMFTHNAVDYRPSLWVYNERTRSVAGPWRYPAAILSAVVGSLGSSTVTIITDDGECLYARLDGIGETKPEDMEAKGTALGAAFDPAGSEPTPNVAVPYVAQTADYLKTVEVMGLNAVALESPLAPITPVVSLLSYTLTRYFNNAYLARFETPWLDIGDQKIFKNFHEVELTIDRDARAEFGIFTENENGVRSGKWYGQVHGKGKIRVPLNLFGRRIRVRIVAILFNSGRCLIRDALVGYSVGGDN